MNVDNRAADLTKEGMLKGIEQAAAFILFLSSGVLQRPYCQMEIRHALALEKPVVLLHGTWAQSMISFTLFLLIPALLAYPLYRGRRPLRLIRLPRRPRRGTARPASSA